MEAFTAEQAAKALGYHLYHVYRLLANGTLKGQKWAGKAWMISRQEIERIKALQDEHGRLSRREG
jgi:excisionase family DNA binding protein